MNQKQLERNVKIYPFYRAFSYDFLFLWTISIMFLTKIKGFSYSETIYFDAVFTLAAFALQLPITKLIKKIGDVNSIRIGALCFILFILIYIFSSNFMMFLFANVLYGIHAAIANVSDASLLSTSLKKLKRSNEFSKKEGRGTAIHYVVEACSAIIAGYMFDYLNPYSPLVATFVCTIILLILSLFLKEPKGEVKIKQQNKEPFKKKSAAHFMIVKNIELTNSNDCLGKIGYKAKKDESVSYKKLLKDKFIISMMIFCFSFYGIMSVYSSLAKVYYQDIGVTATVLGFIYFGFKMIAAMCSNFQFKYEAKRGVKSLVIFAFLCLLSFGLNGILATINQDAVICIIIISTMFVVQNAIRAPYRIFVKNYINNLMTKNELSKALTLYSMAEYLGFSCITLLVAFVLGITNNSFATTNIVISSLLAVPMIVSIIIFIRQVIKRYTQKNTIIRDDMKDEL